MNKMLQNP